MNRILFIFCFLLFFTPGFVFSIEIPKYEKGKPFSYDGVGKLDSIEKKALVIGDRRFLKNRGIKYHGMRSRILSANKFQEGDFVGYKLNTSREVIHLYLIKSKIQDQNP